MGNTYRVLLPIQVQGQYGQGDEFEHEFSSPAEEQSNLDSGLLEIVPRKYKVVGTSRVFETAPGEEFDAAITMGQEAALIAGGHIERVEEKKKAAPAAATTKEKKGE